MWFISVFCRIFAPFKFNYMQNLRIKAILREKGITSKELAEKMGKTPQYISNTITGTKSASFAVLSEIASALDVEFWELFVSPEEAAQKAHLTHSPDMCCPYCGKPLQVTIGGKE